MSYRKTGKLEGRKAIKDDVGLMGGTFTDEMRQKAIESKRKNLTLKQKRFLSEYMKTGNATQSALAAYDVKKKNASVMGNVVLHHPKIQDALGKAMKKAKLDEDLAVSTLKNVLVEGGANLEKAKPSDVLKGLELFFKLKGQLGSKSSPKVNISFREKAGKMTIQEIQEGMKKLEKEYQKIRGYIEEGEVIPDED